jgi:hypothetical protein
MLQYEHILDIGGRQGVGGGADAANATVVAVPAAPVDEVKAAGIPEPIAHSQGAVPGGCNVHRYALRIAHRHDHPRRLMCNKPRLERTSALSRRSAPRVCAPLIPRGSKVRPSPTRGLSEVAAERGRHQRVVATERGRHRAGSMKADRRQRPTGVAVSPGLWRSGLASGGLASGGVMAGICGVSIIRADEPGADLTNESC